MSSTVSSGEQCYYIEQDSSKNQSDASLCKNRWCGPPGINAMVLSHFHTKRAWNKQRSSPYMIKWRCQNRQKISKKLPGAQLWSCRVKLVLLNLFYDHFAMQPVIYSRIISRRYEIASVKRMSLLTHTPAPWIYIAHMWNGGMCPNYVENHNLSLTTFK